LNGKKRDLRGVHKYKKDSTTKKRDEFVVVRKNGLHVGRKKGGRGEENAEKKKGGDWT